MIPAGSRGGRPTSAQGCFCRRKLEQRPVPVPASTQKMGNIRLEDTWQENQWNNTPDFMYPTASGTSSGSCHLKCPKKSQHHGLKKKDERAVLSDFEEVKQLVQEEGDDVQIALHSQKHWGNPTSEGEIPVVPSENKYDEYDESDDEVSPEVAAAMMHSEEQGILMGAAPLRVYNALFSDNEKDLIAVESAAPFHPQNVVVPASIDKMPFTSSAEDLVALASTIRGKEPLPSTSVFTDYVKQRDLYSSVLEEASKAYVPESEGTGSLDNTSRTSIPGGGAIEYVLDPARPPDHYSCVQLRGSTCPAWFPGYFQALPSIEGMTAVCRDPSTVLEDAWWTLQSTSACNC